MSKTQVDVHYTCIIHINPCILGINVVEVAHDYQVQVQKCIIDIDLKLLNSYDTWHGESHRAMCTLFICSHRHKKCCKRNKRKLPQEQPRVKVKNGLVNCQISIHKFYTILYTIYMCMYYYRKKYQGPPVLLYCTSCHCYWHYNLVQGVGWLGWMSVHLHLCDYWYYVLFYSLPMHHCEYMSRLST